MKRVPLSEIVADAAIQGVVCDGGEYPETDRGLSRYSEPNQHIPRWLLTMAPDSRSSTHTVVTVVAVAPA